MKLGDNCAIDIAYLKNPLYIYHAKKTWNNDFKLAVKVEWL